MGIVVSDDKLAGRMSVAEFRAFQDRRPDHERWELISGVPMMMTPATIAHNRIASNLEWLLNNALGRFDRSRLATQRPGIELGSLAFRPEPDVGVIDADYAAGQRFVERCYLLAEIVSATDELPVPGSGGRWIDVKREIYLAHPPCEAVLIVEQDRIEVAVDIRSNDGWTSARLSGPEAELRLPAFGLSCALAALYDGTPLMPRSA
ncbi:Uma2 family endonuclease [Rhodopseudomonas rhenobacensis]|uniref:Uma2 family endonuclease n=1 Tax=Rhodopseudomonas rhenobacensis TaxID=87461 RepID=A0A7W7Z2H0_9BRAD|nr:Uma2 family endonuclease [Rhodopseudomonas rhenobacensis]MBB5046825.1 Uma2 family endonuclease [Rhodopseudomonas rhenobacensis]